MPSKTLTAWSFSRMEFYKNCAFAAKLKYIDRVTEAERPPPVRGKEHANVRGSRMHDNAEAYVMGDDEKLCAELKHFEDELFCLRIMRAQHPDRVIPEQLWLFDKDWGLLPHDVEKDHIWLRIIADMQIWNHDHTELHLIDYKSGKRDRNEVKHGKQLQLYQLSAFMRFPKLKHILASLWYLDLDLKIDQPFTRERGLKLFPIWNDQANFMCNDDVFNANPSAYRCRFCPYQTGGNKWITGTGDCSLNP